MDFDAEGEFPPDDTGYGFDNIGDVLTVSPMLLEKYISAATTIVQEAVPVVGKTRPNTPSQPINFITPAHSPNTTSAAAKVNASPFPITSPPP